MMKKKKLLATVLSAALAFTCMPTQEIGMTNVFAEEEIASDFDIDENGVLKKYNGAGGDVVIPDGVTNIRINAFKDCSSITSITIPESVTIIESSAFAGCSGLTSITIPDGVTTIGNYIFYGCSSITSITIPESVTYIARGVFADCSGLRSIKVSPGNKFYDSRENSNAIIETKTNVLIAGCQNTTIPEGVVSIGDRAFEACYTLTSVTIPEGVVSIGDRAFEACHTLTSVTIPNGVTEIGIGAFENCISLTGITIPNSVTKIGSDAFYNCSSLMSITIPESVTEIGSGAFSETKWLENRQAENPLVILDNIVIDGKNCEGDVEIPKGVRMIADSAFSDYESLMLNTNISSITIPESVTNIGEYAFHYSSLKTIKGKTGSYAQKYAEENGYEFIEIDDDNNILSGDLDGNKKIDLNDATLLLKAAVGIITLTDQQQKSGDINKDTKINLNDARLLLRIAVGIAN